MKRLNIWFIIMFMLLNLVACEKVNSSTVTNTQSSGQEKFTDSRVRKEVPTIETRTSSASEHTMKILIAYFSRDGENYNVGNIEKGNTQIIAEMIAEQTGGTLFNIQTKNPYPEDYDECTEIAQNEKESKTRPKLDESVDNMDDYDVIFLGYPIWWDDMPMAVYTFLESYDFTGKKIIPFCTHEGSGLAGTKNSIADICSTATVTDGIAIRGTSAQEKPDEAKDVILSWINKIVY